MGAQSLSRHGDNEASGGSRVDGDQRGVGRRAARKQDRPKRHTLALGAVQWVGRTFLQVRICLLAHTADLHGMHARLALDRDLSGQAG